MQYFLSLFSLLSGDLVYYHTLSHQRQIQNTCLGAVCHWIKVTLSACKSNVISCVTISPCVSGCSLYVVPHRNDPAASSFFYIEIEKVDVLSELMDFSCQEWQFSIFTQFFVISWSAIQAGFSVSFYLFVRNIFSVQIRKNLRGILTLSVGGWVHRCSQWGDHVFWQPCPHCLPLPRPSLRPATAPLVLDWISV